MVLRSWNPEFTICPFQARIWPCQAPKTLRFKGEMANFEAENTIKQEKKHKRTNGTHFTPVHPPPSLAPRTPLRPRPSPPRRENKKRSEKRPPIGPGKNQQTRKHINKIFTGLPQDYPGTVAGQSRPFPEISWEFCLCVSLFPQEKGNT